MKRGTHEKGYLKTLESMDAKTLAAYMVRYFTKALELKEQLASVMTELDFMHGILIRTLEKEKK